MASASARAHFHWPFDPLEVADGRHTKLDHHDLTVSVTIGGHEHTMVTFRPVHTNDVPALLALYGHKNDEQGLRETVGLLHQRLDYGTSPNLIIGSV